MDQHPEKGRAGSIRPDPMTPDGRDILITRIIDAEASGEDWRDFRVVAERDPSIWRDLAEAQKQHEGLCEALRCASAVADGVDLPEFAVDPRPLQRRFDAVARWGGWAAAAALVLVWSTGAPRGTTPGTGMQTGSLGRGGPSLAEATPDQAMERYIAAGQNDGRVVGEMPERLVIETRPRDDGTVEVVYLRQIIERRVTGEVYRETHDDAGRVVPVAVPVQAIQRRSAF